MTLALVLAGCFVGFLLSSTTGLGGALVMIPLVSLIAPAQAAIALSAPVMLVNNLGKMAVLRGALDRAFLRRTLIGAAPGAAAGALLVGVVPDAWLRRAVGAFMIGYVAYELAGRPGPRRAGSRRTGSTSIAAWGAVTGFVSAVVGAAGPTNAAAMDAAGLSRQTFVATGAAVAVAVHLVKLPIFAWNGALRARDLPLCAGLCAVAVAAAFAGRAVLARMSERAFRGVLLASLVVLGAMMLAQRG